MKNMAIIMKTMASAVIIKVRRDGYDDDYCHYDSNTTDEDSDNDNGDDDDDDDDDGQRCIECNEVELNGSN